MSKANESQDFPSSTDRTNLLMESIQSIMKNKTIETEILSIKNEVEIYHSLTETADDEEKGQDSDYNIEKSIKSILEKITNGEITNTLLSNLHFSTIYPKEPKEKEKSLIALSEIHLAIAQAALEENNLTWAWGAAHRARGYLSYLIGMHDQTNHAQYNRAKAGGLKKSANKNKANEMMIDVIRQKRSSKGWKSPSAAVDEILEPIIELIRKENFKIPTERSELTHHLINFIIENKEAKKAFEEQPSH